MKKIIIVCGLAVLAFAAGILLRSPAPRGKDDGLSCPDRILCDVQTNSTCTSLFGTFAMELQNPAGEDLREIVLRAYPNAEQSGSLTFSGMTANGKSVLPYFDEDSSVLRIQTSWGTQEMMTITGSFQLSPVGSSFRDGLLAMDFLPMPARYSENAWQTGELMCGPDSWVPYDLTMKITVPDQYAAAGNGTLTEETRENGKTTYTYHQGAARDISLAVWQGRIYQKEDHGVLITASDEKDIKATREALARLRKTGFSYPFSGICILSGVAETDGKVLSGLALTDGAEGEALVEELSRLLLQQIFGVLIGTDSENPWLSVSVASGAELLCYGKTKGTSALESRYRTNVEPATRLTHPRGVTIGAPLSVFADADEVAIVLRDSGGAMILGMPEAAGEAAFVEALNAYAEENAGRKASMEAFLSSLWKATGSRWDGYLKDWLEMQF